MSEIDLKPCPFCGRKVEAYFNGAREMASCTNCCEEWEISAWQSRPIEDGLRAELAELRTVVTWARNMDHNNAHHIAHLEYLMKGISIP